MTEKTLFRGYSLTKPIAVIGMLRLIDEGRVRLNDNVGSYIASFRNLVVLKKNSTNVSYVSVGDSECVEPLKRTMTIAHLLNHTSGVGYGPMRDSERQRLVARTTEEKIYRPLVKAIDDGVVTSLADLCDRIARLPLLFQPGDRYLYSFGIDIIGRIIEIVADQPLDQFIRARVLQPLGMMDTAFIVSSRVAAQHLSAQYHTLRAGSLGRRERKLVKVEGTSPSECAWVAGSPVQPSAAAAGGFWGSCGRGGLLFSLRDIARFCSMLVNDGVALSGQRILKEKTAKSMRRDWLSLRSVSVRQMGKRPLLGFDDQGGSDIGWCPIGHVEMKGKYKGAIFMGGVGHWWVDARRRIVAATLHETIPVGNFTGWNDDLDSVSQVVRRALVPAHHLPAHLSAKSVGLGSRSRKRGAEGKQNEKATRRRKE